MEEEKMVTEGVVEDQKETTEEPDFLIEFDGSKSNVPTENSDSKDYALSVFVGAATTIGVIGGIAWGVNKFKKWRQKRKKPTIVDADFEEFEEEDFEEGSDEEPEENQKKDSKDSKKK